MGRIYAIVLAAGRGSRMQSETPKQFMKIGGHEVLWYSLKAMEESCVTDVVVVTSAEYVEYVRRRYLEAGAGADFGNANSDDAGCTDFKGICLGDSCSDGYDLQSTAFRKVRAVVAGGDERYDSVYEGLKAILRLKGDSAVNRDMTAMAAEQKSYVLAEDAGDLVLIHDGARPLVMPELIARTAEGAARYRACIPGIPVKDTVRFIGEDGSCGATPDRSQLRAVQTPQAFDLELCCEAYDKLHSGQLASARITDDAMVVEAACGVKAMFVDGDCRNIKITTPEDILTAEQFLRVRSAEQSV